MYLFLDKLNLDMLERVKYFTKINIVQLNLNSHFTLGLPLSYRYGLQTDGGCGGSPPAQA
jgi:hypothetical protein